MASFRTAVLQPICYCPTLGLGLGLGAISSHAQHLVDLYYRCIPATRIVYLSLTFSDTSLFCHGRQDTYSRDTARFFPIFSSTTAVYFINWRSGLTKKHCRSYQIPTTIIWRRFSAFVVLCSSDITFWDTLTTSTNTCCISICSAMSSTGSVRFSLLLMFSFFQVSIHHPPS